MKLLLKLIINGLLFFFSLSVFAGTHFAAEGAGSWVSGKMQNFEKKYQLDEPDVEGIDTTKGTIKESYIGNQIRGYQLRYGVYMLQTLFNTGVIDHVLNTPIRIETDLILEDINAAKAFEKELKSTTTNSGKWYIREDPVPVVGEIDRTVAVAYMVPGPAPNTVQIKHYFMDNPWGWVPEKDE